MVQVLPTKTPFMRGGHNTPTLEPTLKPLKVGVSLPDAGLLGWVLAYCLQVLAQLGVQSELCATFFFIHFFGFAYVESAILRRTSFFCVDHKFVNYMPSLIHQTVSSALATRVLAPWFPGFDSKRGLREPLYCFHIRRRGVLFLAPP